jgi:hypothetical protein
MLTGLRNALIIQVLFSAFVTSIIVDGYAHSQWVIADLAVFPIGIIRGFIQWGFMLAGVL